MFTRFALFLIVGSLCSGCNDDPEKVVPGDGGPDSGNEEMTVSGSVVGDNVPTAAKTVVIWSVSSGSPDYGFKYGEGTSTGGKFTLTMSLANPPADAINSYGVGIGFVALVPSSTVVPEGKLTNDQLQLLGLTTQHAIIWKAASASVTGGWMKTFPTGFACGQCVPAAQGAGFDSFAPVNCTDLRIEAPSDIETLETCNWT